MENRKLLELMNLAIDISKMGDGKRGFPDIDISGSTYIRGITIKIRDAGFDQAGPRDGDYWFGFDGGISDRTYSDCKRHLEELKARAEGFSREVAQRDTRL